MGWKVYLTYTFTPLSITEGSQGVKSSRNLKQKLSRGHGGLLFSGLLFVACPVCCRIPLSATCSRMAPPTMTLELSHLSLIKEMAPLDFPTFQANESTFFPPKWLCLLASWQKTSQHTGIMFAGELRLNNWPLLATTGNSFTRRNLLRYISFGSANRCCGPGWYRQDIKLVMKHGPV